MVYASIRCCRLFYALIWVSHLIQGCVLSCSKYNRALGYRLHRYRIPLALAFVLPTIAGNIILWKSPRDNKAALLGGLYIVWNSPSLEL
jgi:hypothetical protein